MLYNVDPILEHPRPSHRSLVYIGGLGFEAASPADSLTLELERGRRGVVLVSFGSVVPTTLMPSAFLENIASTIAALVDYHFLLKVDKDDKASVSDPYRRQYAENREHRRLTVGAHCSTIFLRVANQTCNWLGELARRLDDWLKFCCEVYF